MPDGISIPALLGWLCVGRHGRLPVDVKVNLSPAAAERLLFAGIIMLRDRRMDVLRARLAGQHDQFLCTVPLRIDVGHERQADALKVIQPEVNNFYVFGLSWGNRDAGTLQVAPRHLMIFLKLVACKCHYDLLKRYLTQHSSRLGIEFVYQDLALAENLDVVANMFLGRELYTFPWRLDEVAMEKATIATLKSLGVTTLQSVRQPVAGLSGGQRQAIAVAKAVMWNSKVVILDEPTAALGVAQTRQVLNLVRRLADQGLAVVVISHNLHDIFEVTDRIAVLRLGNKVAEYKTRDTTHAEVVHAITAGTVDEPAESSNTKRAEEEKEAVNV